jgi:DUF4097 and DUF4098 domain-containing protein YvlB
MKALKRINLFLVCLVSIFLVTAYAGETQEIDRTFAAKKTVQIKTVSGDCVVKTAGGSKIQVHVAYTYPKDVYEPVFKEEGDTLVLQEKFKGSGSGKSTWTVTVPAKTGITFHSASGDFSAAGLKGTLNGKTASGDFEIKDLEGDLTIGTASGDLEADNISGNLVFKAASGDIEGRNLEGDMAIKTASGDIEIEEAKGSFEVKTANGEIEASKIILRKASSFKTASGEVEIQLAESAKYDLTLASATGDVVLDYNGHPFKGYFEFTAKKSSGEIECPVKFDKEEEIEHHGQKYLKKSFSRGGNTPKILLKTASGTAELQK